MFVTLKIPTVWAYRVRDIETAWGHRLEELAESLCVDLLTRGVAEANERAHLRRMAEIRGDRPPQGKEADPEPLPRDQFGRMSFGGRSQTNEELTLDLKPGVVDGLDKIGIAVGRSREEILTVMAGTLLAGDRSHLWSARLRGLQDQMSRLPMLPAFTGFAVGAGRL